MSLCLMRGGGRTESSLSAFATELPSRAKTLLYLFVFPFLCLVTRTKLFREAAVFLLTC